MHLNIQLLSNMQLLFSSDLGKCVNACVTTQSQVPLPLIFLSYCTFTVPPALSALRQTHACSNSFASTAKPMAFALCPPHLEQSPPRHQALCYSLFLQKQTQDIRRHFSSQNISAKQHCPSPLSVCTVCVCASFAYLRLNLCLHYVLSFSFFLIYIFFKLPIAFLSPCTAMMMMHFLQTYA